MSNSIVEALDFNFIRNVLSAKGDCGKVEHLFPGFFSFITIPMLSFIAFTAMGIWGLYILRQNAKADRMNRSNFR